MTNLKNISKMNEDQWLSKLEKQVADRIKKKELCEFLGINYDPSFNSFRYEFFETRLISRLKKVREYGLDWKPAYIRLKSEEIIPHLDKLKTEKEKINNRKSLTSAARQLGITIHDLNALRIRGLISYEQIGRTFYFEINGLKEELKQPVVQNYFKEHKRNYSIS